jgi:hypothetical protein
VRGEDETTDKIRRGLALSDASRHRPDIGHPLPMKALEVYICFFFSDSSRHRPDIGHPLPMKALEVCICVLTLLCPHTTIFVSSYY